MHFWSSTPGPLLYAHRGAKSEAPENTLIAFSRALDHGADVLELDVHCSRDGVFVVSHDGNGARMCNVPRAIRACSWSEISSWDAGWGYQDSKGSRPFAGRGIHPARFEQVLSEFGSAALNVDIKAASEPEIRRLVELIRAERSEERVLLTSFSKERVDQIRALRYRGPLGLSRAGAVRLLFVPELLNRVIPFGGERAQIPTHWLRFDLSRSERIDKVHRLGLSVDYWVVNTTLEAEELIERDADGIMTDEIARMAELFRRLPRTEAWRSRHPRIALDVQGVPGTTASVRPSRIS